MSNSINRRLQILEKVSGIDADQVTITLADGTTKRLLWSEALIVVLDDEAVEIDGTGDLYGLCRIMKEG